MTLLKKGSPGSCPGLFQGPGRESAPDPPEEEAGRRNAPSRRARRVSCLDTAPRRSTACAQASASPTRRESEPLFSPASTITVAFLGVSGCVAVTRFSGRCRRKSPRRTRAHHQQVIRQSGLRQDPNMIEIVEPQWVTTWRLLRPGARSRSAPSRGTAQAVCNACR